MALVKDDAGVLVKGCRDKGEAWVDVDLGAVEVFAPPPGGDDDGSWWASPPFNLAHPTLAQLRDNQAWTRCTWLTGEAGSWRYPFAGPHGLDAGDVPPEAAYAEFGGMGEQEL